MKRKKKSGRNGLTAADLEKFRDLLLAKRNEILGNVATIENETLRKERSELSTMPLHMADAGSDNFEQDFALDLMDSERKLLLEINEALDRIEEGTYGVCQGKGEAIPKARLNAIPWAKYCVKCAELKEKGLLEKWEKEPEYVEEDEGEGEDWGGREE